MFAALPLCLLACGDDGGGGGGDDDPSDPDAEVPEVDADNSDPAWACSGDSHPTTAPGTLVVSGVTEEINQDGTVAIDDVTVAAFNATNTEIATTTSAATTGTYSLSLTTGGTPLAGYLRGSLASGFKTTYVYPPASIATDLANIPVLMVSNTTWAFLPLLASAEQVETNGFVGILVVDCMGTPVAGATVSVAGVPAENIRYVADGGVSPDNVATDATGIALIFNVPVSASVMVDAMVPGHDFEGHPIEVRADVITTTVVAPGPITGLAP